MYYNKKKTTKDAIHCGFYLYRHPCHFVTILFLLKVVLKTKTKCHNLASPGKRPKSTFSIT